MVGDDYYTRTRDIGCTGKESHLEGGSKESARRGSEESLRGVGNAHGILSPHLHATKPQLENAGILSLATLFSKEIWSREFLPKSLPQVLKVPL